MKKLFSIVLLILFSNSLLAKNESITNLFNEGDYFTIAEFVKTKKIYKQEDARLATIALFKINQFNEAIKIGLKVYRKYPDISYIMGQSFYALNKKSDAYRFFKRCVAIEHKKDVSLFYMASIAKDKKRIKLAAKLFHLIFENRGFDNNIRQVAMNEKAEIFQRGYKENGYTSPKIFQKKVLPLLEKALDLNPESDLAPQIEKRLQVLKNKYRVGSLESLISFNQSLGRNSNVIYQSISPLVNNTSDSLYSSTFLNYSKNIGIPIHIPVEVNAGAFLSNDYFINDESTIQRFNKISTGFNITGKLTPKLKDKNRYWKSGISYLYSQMDNQIDGNLVFDHHSLSLFLERNVNRTNFGASANVFKSFDAQSDFYFIDSQVSFLKKTSKKSNYLLKLMVAGSFYPNTNLLNTIDTVISGNFNYLNTSKSYLIFGIDYKSIYPYKNSDVRGLEHLFDISTGYNYYFNSSHSIGLNLQYQRKISKDETNFSFEQNIASLNYNFHGGF